MVDRSLETDTQGQVASGNRRPQAVNIMRTVHRRTLFLALAGFLSGCADNMPQSYYAPPPLIPLQDPLPGHGILYLLRAPHDQETFSVQLGGKQSFTLEPATYSVISLKPGDYAMTGTIGSILGGPKEAFAPARFRLQEGQRAFLYVSGVSDTSFFLNSIIPAGRGILFVDGGIKSSTAAGTRSWKECTELDAQGFMSVSKPKLIE